MSSGENFTFEILTELKNTYFIKVFFEGLDCTYHSISKKELKHCKGQK